MNMRLASTLLALAVLAACVGGPRVEPETAPVSDNSAVVALVAQAHTDLDSGRRDNAAAAIERALRIEPRNPLLWHELAKVRLAEGRHPQAEQLATKSNSLATGNKRLKAANLRLIAAARAGRGDNDGAQAALSQAAELER
jgi:tetratricopeptide (TPR) repeat protein